MKYIVVALLGCLTTCGCSASGLMKASSSAITAPIKAISKGKKQRPVAKILCLWEPAEGQGLDEKPSRGFAGQIMFFGHGDPSPMTIHGKVKIFEYTDYDAADEDPEPVHTFTFNDGGWNAHRVDGTIGKTYNVFLPYVEKKKGHVVCALRVEFETEDGHTISSPFTEVTLASKTSNKAVGAFRRNIVKQVSGKRSASRVKTAHAQKTSPAPRTLKTTTIPLP